MRMKSSAYDQGYKPLAASEYLIFIEASQRVYAWYDARDFSRAARESSEDVFPAICRLWTNAEEWAGTAEAYLDTQPEFTCPE
jgi:hypothetical protein